MADEKKCKDRVKVRYDGRMESLRRIVKADNEGKPDPDYGPLNEYGLSFDYVAPGTFTNQREGYFRYQLSWGGPSDEFRFYTGPELKPHRIEYWFLDWYDGAHITLEGEDFDFMADLFDGFYPQGAYDKSKEG